MTRASEGGHWYDRDGTPRYEVIGANGNPRPATLRDARKFGWYPGCTSVIKCAAAPGLEIWKQKQVLLAARTIPHVKGETDEQMIERIMADSQEQSRQARERGTEIHAAIQGHFEGKPPSEEMWPYVQGVVATLRALFGDHPWVPERPVAHPLGFGTKSDLHTMAGNIALDFKGAEFTRDEFHGLKTWDEHHMQLGATREALHMPTATCAIVYVSRNVPGLAKVCIVEENDLRRGWDMFRGLLNYWQAKSNYWPALWKAEEAT